MTENFQAAVLIESFLLLLFSFWGSADGLNRIRLGVFLDNQERGDYY